MRTAKQKESSTRNKKNRKLSRLFTGSPTNKTMWLMIGGLVLTIAGVLGLTRRK